MNETDYSWRIEDTFWKASFSAVRVKVKNEYPELAEIALKSVLSAYTCETSFSVMSAI